MTATRPKLSDKLTACVRFARFVRDHDVLPGDLADLLHFARLAFKAGERECNTGVSADKFRDRFEDKAKEMGFGVTWPGLWPVLVAGKKGEHITLPEV